jgi:ribosomal protein S18 acetylase RimI-like enzyme
MSQITCQQYRAEFASGVQAVALTAWQHTYKEIFDATFINAFVNRNYSAPALDNSLPRLAAGIEFFEVALDGDEVIGFCNIGDRGAGWELFRIYILPKFLGQGIGKALSIHGEEFLRSKAASQVFCFVHKDNEIGKAFYFKSGFVHRPEKDKADEWFMQKAIS